MVARIYRHCRPKIDTANAVHLLRNLTSRTANRNGLISICCQTLLDVRASRASQASKIRAAWKFAKHDGFRYITDIFEKSRRPRATRPFLHRLIPRSEPAVPPARRALASSSCHRSQQQKLHDSAPYPSSLATRAKLQTRPSVSTGLTRDMCNLKSGEAIIVESISGL